MSTVRVTQGMMVARTLSDLNYQTRKLLKLQEQLSTGQKVNKPSDDPLAARRAVNIDASIARQEQYMSNISTSESMLTESTSSIETVESIVQRVRELVLAGATGTNSQDQLDEIAIEVNQLMESVLTEANHQTNGRYVFGGTRTLSEPFVATRDADGQITSVSYVGNDGDIEIAVGDGVSVKINESGEDVFQSTQDVFQTLIDIRDSLVSGDQTTLQADSLNQLQDIQSQLLVSTARLGATQNRLESISENLETYTEQLTATRSDNVDADYADTVINLNAQSNAYTAALQAAGSVLQRSLLDFIG